MLATLSPFDSPQTITPYGVSKHWVLPRVKKWSGISQMKIPLQQYTNAENSTPQLTYAFIAWRKSDRLLRGWIIGTLSEETLRFVVGLDTAHAIWEALKNAYTQDSQECEFTLQQQVTYLRKEDNTTITEHIRTFKGLYDNLLAIGKLVPDQEKVFCLLTSLGPHYETFTTAMLKPPRPSYSELQQRPQPNISGYHAPPQDSPPMVMDSKLNSKGTLLQQTLNVDLHHLICWWVPKKPAQQDEIPQALATLTLDSTIVDTEWTTDTWASNHMTDGGGEFINSKLTSHFLSTGIVHQVSSPYTPKQTEAFTTPVYLMNRLPSSALNFEIPYFTLHGTHPDIPHFDHLGLSTISDSPSPPCQSPLLPIDTCTPLSLSQNSSPIESSQQSPSIESRICKKLMTFMSPPIIVLVLQHHWSTPWSLGLN
ncbi:hypothetical protein Pint_06033 [Pistacia integerrima]|uniref:Uncharacterized protein n=1 Tax=Pistacia integerrima TaxID=434235 RepID=A0ACC0Z908_9ROSI|nr:hypothetical protein Pint_06033 [Pistacia integerrima]